MIYVSDPLIDKSRFEKLLDSTKNAVLCGLESYGHPDRVSGEEFEQIVYDEAVACARGSELDGLLIHTADREFPDIVAADYWGVEVKATKKDSWTSIGNSVLESSRIPGVERIYMFFGKLGGIPDIRFRNYEDCLRGIAVTHYPRYQIDMNLPDGQSIFHKMGVPYDDIRCMENPVKTIRKYYRQNMHDGESLWWIDDETENFPALSPYIRDLSSIPLEEKNQVIASVMAFFPEIFSEQKTKYKRIPAFLVSQYGLVTANLRDFFTAGGQVLIDFGGNEILVPQIVYRTETLAAEIEKCLMGKSKNKLEELWGHSLDCQYANPIEAWCAEADRQFNSQKETFQPLVTWQFQKGLRLSEGTASRGREAA